MVFTLKCSFRLILSLKWVNNPTLTEFCFGMIGRADIEGSKSNVAMNAWLPQASSLNSKPITFLKYGYFLSLLIETSSYLKHIWLLKNMPAPYRAFEC